MSKTYIQRVFLFLSVLNIFEQQQQQQQQTKEKKKEKCPKSYNFNLWKQNFLFFFLRMEIQRFE